MQRSTTHLYRKYKEIHQQLQRSIVLIRLEMENYPEADIPLYKDQRNVDFSSKANLSCPSKLRAFLSSKILSMRQLGIAFQMLILQCQPYQPCQQASKSTTAHGIIHWTLKRPKTNEQWISKWLSIFLLFLHKQNQSITITCHFIRLSMVRIHPKLLSKE